MTSAHAICGFVLYKYLVPGGSQVGSITFAHMQHLQQTGACVVCYEGLNGKAESDDYQANLEYWLKNRPSGEDASLEWDMHRPVIIHPVDIVSKTGLASKIHWMCYGCLHNINPETQQYYLTQCPVCNNRKIDRSNIEHHAEPQAVAVELDPELVAQLSRPLPYYQHPHPQSDENMAVRWYRQQGLLELEERQLQEQQDRDAERLIELEAIRQHEQIIIARQERQLLADEQAFAEHLRSIQRQRQRQNAEAEQEARRQQQRENRHIEHIRFRERQRRDIERRRQESNHNTAARQKPPPNATVFSQWRNY